jgi:acyl-CoA hydrolase
MEPKPVSASAMIDQVVEVLPETMDAQGVVVGSKLMQSVDNLASLVAERHAGIPCVVMSIDSVRFFHSARQGDVLICKASVNRAWDTSMEIGVKVIAEDFRTLEQKDVLSAYFTFGASGLLAAVSPETPDQLARFEKAEERRLHRLKDDKSAHTCA